MDDVQKSPELDKLPDWLAIDAEGRSERAWMWLTLRLTNQETVTVEQSGKETTTSEESEP